MAKLSRERLLKVGFSGPSGAGKTTSCEYFGRHTGFTALEGDEIMFKGLSVYPERTIKIFGRALEPGENEREFAYGNYLPLTYEKEYNLFELMRDYVEEQLRWAFHNPTTDFRSHDVLHEAVLFQPEGLPEGIAAEMCGFHRAKDLKRDTDFTVIVDSNPGQRKKMLAQRPNMQGFIKAGMFDEIIAIRETVQGDLLKGARPHLRIKNNYDEESLIRGQQQIIAKMKEKGFEVQNLI